MYLCVGGCLCVRGAGDRKTLYDTVFMGGVKVKASGCAVIVGDVLIKAF